MEETRTADASEQALAETAVGEASVGGPRARARVPDVPVAGDAIGRYVVIDVLGRGGMGVVLSAFDPELDRKIAVKLLRSGGGAGSTIGRQRLVREAQAMAKLSHPNVISVHDVGEWQGQVFVAMEFVDGQTLKQWVGQRPREWGEVVAMYAQAAAGLEAAHRAGIVHRDFKPDNCMIDREGRLRVLDFGLASDGAPTRKPTESPKAAPSERSMSSSSLTQTGAIMGTPAYMAPEQHLGAPTSARSDQFSFCVALYEAIYGTRPFAGDSPASLMFNVLEGNLRTPDGRAGTPVWLLRTLTRGLSKEPDARWPSMSELIEALERPVRTRQRLRRVAALVGVAVVVAGGFLVAKGLERRKERARLAEREQAAQHRLDQLLPGFERMASQGDGAQAFQSMESFAGLDDVRETRAVSAGWLALSVALQGAEADELGLQASANAFASAPDHAAQQDVLLAMVEPFVGAQRWGSLKAVLSRLDGSRQGEPAVRRASLRSAFVDGDFARAAQLGDTQDSEATGRALGALAVFSGQLQHATRTDLGAGNQVAFARVADGSARVVEVDGGELVVRAGTAQLEELSRTALPIERAAKVLPLQGTDTVLVRSRIKGTQEHLNLFVTGNRVETAPDDLGSVVGVAAGDLDGDGTLEHFGAVSYYRRQLAQFEQVEDLWKVSYPHQPTNALKSDIDDVVAGDFDGDGRTELAVAIGPWSGYMVRVLRMDEATGRLEHVDSLELGSVRSVSALRDGERMRLFAHKIDTGTNPGFFSEQQPHGPYDMGLYEVALDGDTLTVVGEHPSPVNWSETSVLDIDGDGRDELAAATRSGTVIFTQEGLFAHTEAFRLVATGNLDDDGRDELIVARDDAVYVLGAGDEHLEPVARPAPEHRDVPPELGDESETTRGIWRRGETLVQIGLAAQAVAVFEDLVPLCSTDGGRAAAVLRAAELAREAVSLERALEVYEAALRGSTDWAIARPAAELAEQMHEFERAEQLWRDGPPGPERSEALERLAELTAEPVVLLSPNQFLPPSTTYGWPGAVSFRRGRGAMLVAPAGEGELARIPLEVTGGYVSVRLEGTWTASDWGAGLSVRLRNEEGRNVSSVALVTNGGASGIRRVVRGVVHDSWDADVDDSDEISVRLEALGSARLFQVESRKSLLDRRQVEREVRPGRYELVIESGVNPDTSPLLNRLEIRSLSVRGATVVDSSPDARSERLHRAAQGDANQWDGVEEADTATALWIALELERGGDREAALERLSKLDPEQDRAQWEIALRLDGGRFVSLFRARMGADVWPLWANAWRLVGYQHPESRELGLALQTLPEDLDAVVAASEALALMLWWRGRAHFQRGELRWARRDLERAVELTESYLEREDNAEVLMAHGGSCRLLARIERSRAAEDAAQSWEERYIAASSSPDTARRLVDRERGRVAQSTVSER